MTEGLISPIQYYWKKWPIRPSIIFTIKPEEVASERFFKIPQATTGKDGQQWAKLGTAASS